MIQYLGMVYRTWLAVIHSVLSSNAFSPLCVTVWDPVVPIQIFTMATKRCGRWGREASVANMQAIVLQESVSMALAGPVATSTKAMQMIISRL